MHQLEDINSVNNCQQFICTTVCGLSSSCISQRLPQRSCKVIDILLLWLSTHVSIIKLPRIFPAVCNTPFGCYAKGVITMYSLQVIYIAGLRVVNYSTLFIYHKTAVRQWHEHSTKKECISTHAKTPTIPQASTILQIIHTMGFSPPPVIAADVNMSSHRDCFRAHRG